MKTHRSAMIAAVPLLLGVFVGTQVHEPRRFGSAIEIAKNRFHWKRADGSTVLDGRKRLPRF